MGEKYISEELKATTCGSDWKTFFNHLTIIGLQNGERCKFIEID
jgi:hypothetical protein